MPLDVVELRRILGPTLQYVGQKLDVASGVLASVATAIRDASGDVFPFGDISDGQYLVRSGSQIIGGTPTPGGPPTGAAGGDLGTTYPNPTVVALHETAGPTKLTLGAVADGQVLTRSGTTLIGSTPSAGGVTSFNARTGAVTPQSADYTAAQVGAISSANTGISALTLKSVPASGDSIAINDAVASNALKRIDVASLPYIPVTVLTRTGNPMLDLPATPNGWDDEFVSGSADLLVRGWDIRLAVSPYTQFTRVGAVDFTDYNLSSITTTQYRSSIIGSSLYLQVKSAVTISKAIAAGGLFAARATPGGFVDSQGIASTIIANQHLWGVTNRTVGSQDLWNVGGTYTVIGSSGGTQAIDIGAGWTTGDHSNTIANGWASGGVSETDYDISAIRLFTGTTECAQFLAASATQRVGWRGRKTINAAFAPTCMFLYLNPTNPSSTTTFNVTWYVIDYFRQYGVNGWFG